MTRARRTPRTAAAARGRLSPFARLALGLSLGAGLLLCAPRARAGDVAEQAAAEALFREARRLQKTGSISAACAKFAESHRIDPGLGTLLNLADCHVKEGKTATAWAEYTQAIAMAVEARQKTRAELARKHAASLEARLSRVVLTTSAASAGGLRIKIGDKELSSAVIGTGIPLDPGAYRVEVTAPGKRPWSTEIDLPAGPTEVKVSIPPLPDDVSSPPAAAAPETGRPSDTGASTRRVAGLVLGGVGIVGLGVGTYFGIRTFSKQGEVEDSCEGALCTQAGLDADEDAHTSATVSTIAFAAGAAFAAAGVILVLTSGAVEPSARGGDAALWLSPRVGAHGTDVALGGAW